MAGLLQYPVAYVSHAEVTVGLHTGRQSLRHRQHRTPTDATSHVIWTFQAVFYGKSGWRLLQLPSSFVRKHLKGQGARTGYILLQAVVLRPQTSRLQQLQNNTLTNVVIPALTFKLQNLLECTDGSFLPGFVKPRSGKQQPPEDALVRGTTPASGEAVSPTLLR